MSREPRFAIYLAPSPPSELRRFGCAVNGRDASTGNSASSAEVTATTGIVERWVEQLAQRYSVRGPDARGVLRRNNGTTARIGTPQLLALSELSPSAARDGRAAVA